MISKNDTNKNTSCTDLSLGSSAAIAICLTAIVGTSSLFYVYSQRQIMKKMEEKLTKERMAERKGRIRAEMKLRNLVKDSQTTTTTTNNNVDDLGGSKQQQKKSKVVNSENLALSTMSLKCIGTVVTPFTKRMGTPRQGALAPHSRAYIQININAAPMETLSGMELYSHAWIIFQFHANTDIAAFSSKTKVRPPRAGGLKVGQLATRSPHRPNPLGLSLVKITGIDTKHKRLEIAALDLVNGTPVYDIKPVVPWDIPGHQNTAPLKVPTWVSQDDALSSVSFTTEAKKSLDILLQQGKLFPLYKTTTDGAMETICEVLAQDPRCLKKRGTVDGNVVDPYKMVFCSIEVQFIVSALIQSTGTKASEVSVINVSELNLNDATYIDGIPLAKCGTLS